MRCELKEPNINFDLLYSGLLYNKSIPKSNQIKPYRVLHARLEFKGSPTLGNVTTTTTQQNGQTYRKTSRTCKDDLQVMFKPAQRTSVYLPVYPMTKSWNLGPKLTHLCLYFVGPIHPGSEYSTLDTVLVLSCHNLPRPRCTNRCNVVVDNSHEPTHVNRGRSRLVCKGGQKLDMVVRLLSAAVVVV